MKKNKFISVLLILALLMTGCSTGEGARFDHFLDNCLKEYAKSDALSLHTCFAHPTALGIREKDRVSLPDPGYGAGEESLGNREDMLDKLKSFDTSELTAVQQQTAAVLRNDLELSLRMSARYPYHHTILGKNKEATSVIGSLFRYEFREKRDVDRYFALLKDIPAYFDRLYLYEKKRNEEGIPSSRLLAEDTSEELAAFYKTPLEENVLVSTFADRLDSITLITTKEKSDYTEQNKEIIKDTVLPAFRHLETNITRKLQYDDAPDAVCDYPAGSDYYELLLKTNVGTDLTAEDCLTLLKKVYKETGKEVDKLYEENPDLDTEEYSAILTRTEPEDILDYLRQNTLIYFPGIDPVPCGINELPDGLYDPSTRGDFIPRAVDSEGTARIFRSPLMSDSTELYSFLAHEGYPGHLYQTAYANREMGHPIRLYLRNPGYDEGWAVYGELFSTGFLSFEGKDEETAGLLGTLYKDRRIMELCVWSLSDLYVNVEGHSRKELAKWLKDYGISGDDATALYHYVIAHPTDYLRYSIGYYELTELCKTQDGEKSLQDIHRSLLSFGSCPFYLLSSFYELSRKTQ